MRHQNLSFDRTHQIDPVIALMYIDLDFNEMSTFATDLSPIDRKTQLYFGISMQRHNKHLLTLEMRSRPLTDEHKTMHHYHRLMIFF